jgi:phage terminase large subunit-like protein
VSNSFSALADAIEDSLTHDWAGSLARPEQLPPPDFVRGDKSIWLQLMGRGAGKTRAGAEYIRSQAEGGLASHIALVGPTAGDVRDIMVGMLLSIAPNGNRPEWFPSKRLLQWPNGTQAFALSSEEPERIRGFGFSLAWCDELCAWRNINETWDMLQFTMRRGRRPRQVITTTPKPIPLLRKLLARNDIAITRGSTRDNAANLPKAFLDDLAARYAGTRLGKQEIEAEVLLNIENAL